jgi:putative photosynthetic complex assembly protein
MAWRSPHEEADMSATFENTPLPRPILIGAAVMIACVIAGAALTRTTGIGATRVEDSPAVSVIELRFIDMANGGLIVEEAKAGRILAAVAPGQDNFLRGTLRGLARERRRSGIGIEPPFVLTGRADGRLTLEDPTTRRHVDLEAFGPTNAAVFARFLTVPPTSARP